MIKAAFFDIDGTLVPMETRVCSQQTREALRQLRCSGVKIFVATGRAKPAMEHSGLVEGIGFDGYITSNGQYCYDAQGVYHDHPIAAEDLAALYEFLQQHPYPCLFMEGDNSYINFADEGVERFYRQLRGTVPPVQPVERILHYPIYQVAVYRPHAECEPIRHVLTHCRTAVWHPEELDFVPADGGKMAAIQATMAHFSLQREEVIAFGDGENDREMLQAAGIGVAMGNAPDTVKQVADYVTDPAIEEGVVTALRHFGLI